MKKIIATFVLLGFIGPFLFGCGVAEPKQLVPPSGLWVWAKQQAKEQQDVEHTLRINYDNGNWSAVFNQHKAIGKVLSNKVEFTFDNKHTLLVDLPRKAAELATAVEFTQVLSGYILQPELALHYKKIATPLSLLKNDDKSWIAKVKIQPRPYHVFVQTSQLEDGTAFVAIRNPEGNDVLFSNRHLLEYHSDNKWLLVNPRNGANDGRFIELNSAGNLIMQHPRLSATIRLSPATDKQANLYYSRYDSKQPADLTIPTDLDDGWKVSRPDAVGLNPAFLTKMAQAIAAEKTNSERPRLVHSLLIAKSGRLVFEEYFYGHHVNKRHDVRSLGKVFGSVMLGALQQQGHNIDQDFPLLEHMFTSYALDNTSLNKKEVTLHHALTYTTGLDCDSAGQSAGSESAMWAQNSEDDYWRFFAKLPVLREPGERYAYCSGSANAVGYALAHISGLKVHELFHSLIAKPLDFATYHWPLMPNGDGYLGGGMYMRPRDILKIGAMYINNGVWQQQQIIKPAWIDVSTSGKVAITPETTGTTADAFANNYIGGEQAYIWRVDSIASNGQTYQFYEATGNGGQFLINVPELEISVLITGGNYRMGYIWNRWRDEFLSRYIIPSAVVLTE